MCIDQSLKGVKNCCVSHRVASSEMGDYILNKIRGITVVKSLARLEGSVKRG